MTTPESPLNPNSPCILPFKLYGQLQHECLVDVTTGRHWCPTKVDENGEYNFGEGNYGFCTSKCPPLRRDPINVSSYQETTISTNNNPNGKKFDV